MSIYRKLAHILFGPQMTLTAVVTRADGTVENIGVLSKKRSHRWTVSAQTEEKE